MRQRSLKCTFDSTFETCDLDLWPLDPKYIGLYHSHSHTTQSYYCISHAWSCSLYCQHSRSASSSASRRFHWGGSLAPRVWVTKVPSGSQGWSPGWESGEQTLQDAEAICKRCLEVLTAETIKMWICPIHLLILDQNVSRWGRLSEPFRG